MATQEFILTTTPVQILDGTKPAYIQEKRGSLTRWAVGNTAPSTSGASHVILDNDISLPSGLKVWAWSVKDTITLVVSTPDI